MVEPRYLTAHGFSATSTTLPLHSSVLQLRGGLGLAQQPSREVLTIS
jgi:hypothetical protein